MYSVKFLYPFINRSGYPSQNLLEILVWKWALLNFGGSGVGGCDGGEFSLGKFHSSRPVNQSNDILTSVWISKNIIKIFNCLDLFTFWRDVAQWLKSSLLLTHCPSWHMESINSTHKTFCLIFFAGAFFRNVIICH